MRPLAVPGCLVATLALAACSATNEAASVGGPCSSDDVCVTGFCIAASDPNGKPSPWAGGYCSGNCADRSCPQGNCLALADGSNLCVVACQVDTDCRSGYVCDQAVTACLPDCRKGWSCGSELSCNADNGNCQLPLGTAPVGGACAADRDCAAGFCIPATTEDGRPSHWAGGYCSDECAARSCAQGRCLALADGNYYCVAACAQDDDCRAGYVCAKAVAACLPDCREGWSCGDTLVCDPGDGTCQAASGLP